MTCRREETGVVDGRGELSLAGPSADVDLAVSDSLGVQVGGVGAVQLNQFVLPHIELTWPIQVGHPPRPAAEFRERRPLQEAIDTLLAEDGPSPTVVLTGDGGRGKTQLAAATFRRVAETGTDLRIWVNATSRAGILTAYALAARAVRAGGLSLGTANPVQEAGSFLSWLATTTRTWLVVLDDVADPHDLRGLWPDGQAGRILVTTRRLDIARAGKVVNVKGFSSEDSAAYLRDRLAAAHGRGNVSQQAGEGARALAEALGFLPVALAQAAAVIEDEGIDCDRYLQRFRDRARQLADIFPAEAAADEYEWTVATTWSLAIDRADALRPVGLALPALTLAAALDPNGAPEELWTTQAALHFLTELRRRGTGAAAGATTVSAEDDRLGADAARGALRALHRLSLIEHDTQRGPQAVRSHALVQRATLEECEASTRVEAIRCAAHALAEIWPRSDASSEFAQSLRANASTVIAQDDQALWLPSAHPLLFLIGRSLGAAGFAREAEEHFAALWEKARGTLGADDRAALAAQHEYAFWHGQNGHPVQAARLFQTLVADRIRVLGPDHLDTLQSQACLANYTGRSGDVAGALQACRALLTNRLRLQGEEHRDTLKARHDVAYWQARGGDVEAAAAAFSALFDDRDRILGSSDPDTLDALANLAYWTGRAGDLAAAATHCKLLLSYRQTVLGKARPETLSVYRHIAYWRELGGDVDGAAAALEELAADCAVFLEPDHAELHAAHLNLAQLRARAVDAIPAAAAFEQVAADRELVRGADHPETVAARAEAVSWLIMAGEQAQAAPALEKLLDTRARVLGRDHPHTLATKSHLARCRGRAGDAAGAAATFAELSIHLEGLLGADHPDTRAASKEARHWRTRADSTPPT
jgi:hypothetical protein